MEQHVHLSLICMGRNEEVADIPVVIEGVCCPPYITIGQLVVEVEVNQDYHFAITMKINVLVILLDKVSNTLFIE